MDENREERFYDLLEADENDAEAQYQIGLCYLNGDGTDKDTQKAETYFRRASELGHAAAAEMLGKDGIADQSPNLEDVSLPELCLRAEEGDADAQYAAAMQFLEDNQSEAQRYLKMAAEQGHSMACYQLARTMLPDTLDYGCAVHEEQSTYQEAVTLLKNAVDCSCAPAAELLAQCYLYGLGVAHDREQAEKNFERAVRFSTPEQAAEQMLQLALRYAEGEEIDKSLGKAFSWVRKAEQAGMTDARAQFNERSGGRQKRTPNGSDSRHSWPPSSSGTRRLSRLRNRNGRPKSMPNMRRVRQRKPSCVRRKSMLRQRNCISKGKSSRKATHSIAISIPCWSFSVKLSAVSLKC